MPRALIRVFPASRGGILASAWLLGVAVPLLALLFGEKKQGFGSSVPSHQGRTPLGGYLPAGRTQAQPGTPRITLGSLCGSCWDRQGVEGPRSEVGAVGAGTDPVPGIGGLWLSPNRASHSVATPRGLCWPREGLTRASGSLARRGQRGVGRGQCPGMLPRCMVGNSLFSLHHLLAPAMAAADPPRGFPLSAWRVHPSPLLSPPSPRSRHPRAPPEPPGRTRTLQTLPWGPSRLASSVPALPDPSFLRNGGRGAGRVCLSAPSHRRQARALPRPEPCLGPLPVPWHPLGAASSTPAPRPPRPSPPGRAGLGGGPAEA